MQENFVLGMHHWWRTSDQTKCHIRHSRPSLKLEWWMGNTDKCQEARQTNWHWSFRAASRQKAFRCCQFRENVQQISSIKKTFSCLAFSFLPPLSFLFCLPKIQPSSFLAQKFSQVGKHGSPLCPLLIQWAIGSSLTSGPQSVNKGWDSRLRLSHVPFTSEAAVYRRVPCAHAATAGVGRVGQESYTSVCVVQSSDLRSFCLICQYS